MNSEAGLYADIPGLASGGMFVISQQAGQPADAISDRLKDARFGRLHLLAVLVIGFGSMFEVIELAMTGVFSAVFTADVRAGTMSSNQLAWLLSVTSIGAVIGSPIFGLLADRFGRRGPLAMALLTASIFSIWGALTDTPEELIAARLCASLGIGAYIPLAATYLADILPRHLMGRALMTNVAIGGLGGVICGFLTRWFETWQPFGLDGWRCAMLAGAAGAAVCALLIYSLPESPRWLAARKRHAEASKHQARFERAPIKYRWATAKPGSDDPHVQQTTPSAGHVPGLLDRAYRGRLLLVIVLQFAIPWCTSSYAGFTGAVFQARGYDTADALALQSIVMFGVTGGALLSMIIVDRMPRPILLCAGGTLIACSAIAFTATTSVAMALINGLIISMTGAVYTWVLMLYTAESFPPLLRARSSAIAYGVNRLSSMMVPFIVLPLLAGTGEVGLYGLMALAMGGSAILLLFQIMRARAKPPPQNLTATDMRDALVD